MKKLMVVILVLFVTFTVSAQRSEVGLFGGVSYYNGDINPNNQFELSKKPFAYGLFYRYNFDTRLAIKLGYTKGELLGNKDFSFSDNGTSDNNISFTTSINELSAQFEVNFYDFSIKGDGNRISPYIFGGMGLTFYNGTAKYSDVLLPTVVTRPPTYPMKDNNTINGSCVSFPFGLGVKYCPFPNVTTGLEWGMRKTTTDKLDGVYTDPYRVSAANDWYSFAGFWISFRINFFNSERCYY